MRALVEATQSHDQAHVVESLETSFIPFSARKNKKIKTK